MSKRISVEGKTYVVPDDATDDEITEIVGGQRPPVTGEPTGARLYPKGQGPEGEGPIRHWFSDVAEDVRKGGQVTLPGRLLHGLGATGTESGAGGGPGGVGEFVGGPAIGPAVVGHGLASIPEHPIQGTNEVIRGVAQTAAPIVGATVPGAIPTAVTYGGVGMGARRGAEALGADPDTAELAGNAAMIAAPSGIPAVGRLMERNKTGIGVGAGLAAGAHQALKTGNPMWLMGSPPVAAVAREAAGRLGQGMQQVQPTLGIPAPIATPEIIPSRMPMVRRALSARHGAVEQPASPLATQKALPPAGSIQMPPSSLGPVATFPAESDVDMITRGAATPEAEQSEIAQRVLQNKQARLQNARSMQEQMAARQDLTAHEIPEVQERAPEQVEALKTRKAGEAREPVAWPPEAPRVIERAGPSPKERAYALETKGIQEQIRDAAELQDRTHLSQAKREWFGRNAPAEGKGGLIQAARQNLTGPPAGTVVPQTSEETQDLLNQMLKRTKKGQR